MLANSNAGPSFTGRREDFQPEVAFKHWQTLETSHLSQLIVMVQFNPKLAKSAPGDLGSFSKPPTRDRPRYIQCPAFTRNLPTILVVGTLQGAARIHASASFLQEILKGLHLYFAHGLPARSLRVLVLYSKEAGEEASTYDNNSRIQLAPFHTPPHRRSPAPGRTCLFLSLLNSQVTTRADSAFLHVLATQFYVNSGIH